jgi:hypothetical protein
VLPAAPGFSVCGGEYLLNLVGEEADLAQGVHDQFVDGVVEGFYLYVDERLLLGLLMLHRYYYKG